jgi:hypothetical protein
MIGVFFFRVADSSQTRTMRALPNRLTNTPKEQPIMYSTLLHSRRERAASALILAAVTLVAACNTETSFGPTADHVPTSPVLAKGANGGGGSHAIWAVVDKITGDSVGGAVFLVKNSGGTVLTNVTDNSSYDLDPRPGVFDVTLEKDAAEICLYAAPPSRFFNNSKTPKCVSITVGGKIELEPWCVVYLYSAYWWASVNGLPTTKGTYSVSGPNGFSMTVVSNGQNDRATSAYVYVKLPTSGSYTVCQTVPPAGTALPTQPCRTIDVLLGTPVLLSPFANKTT